MEEPREVNNLPTNQVESEEINLSWLFDESTNNNKTNKLKYTDETTVSRIYALARDIDRILCDNRVTYWTSGGTTLGCVRHKGLIPWDDDLDICIYQDDEDKLLSIEPYLKMKGYRLCEEQFFGYRIFHESNSVPMQLELLNYRYPFCDVFMMRKHKNKCSIATGAGRALWPEEYYYIKDIENIERRSYGDFSLNCPANAEQYLSRYYDSNWHSEGVTQNYNHVTREYRNSVKFKLEEHHYQPAKPFR